MRELERHSAPSPTAHPGAAPDPIAIVGRGRLGTALAAALRQAGVTVDGPHGRGADGAGAAAVLLCVPDAEIATAAAAIAPGPYVGHCSGATGLEVLDPHPGFSLHPLMTFAPGGTGPDLAGTPAAVSGATPQTLAIARSIADVLELEATVVAPADRVAYHAAASIASNFLVALEGAAERVAASASLPREALVPLVRQTVDNWSQLGARRALTGPVARGDEPTVEQQRAAVSERAPELVPLFDALVAVTRELAAGDTEEAP